MFCTTSQVQTLNTNMKSQSLLITIIVCLLFTSLDATVLHKFVDVKGNDAIREIRVLYDMYEPSGDSSDSNNESKPSSKTMVTPYAYEWSQVEFNLQPSGSQKTSQPEMTRLQSSSASQHQFHSNVNMHPDASVSLKPNQPSGTIVTHVHHPQFHIEQALSRPPNSAELLANRYKLQNVRAHPLIRGRPMFVEIDFVPRYIPSSAYYVAVSVSLPAHIRGRPWILGWHQEVFPAPACRLCTNRQQSFTLPVTIFLPEDGWCPEGRVPTIWKIEAIARESNTRFLDQTDMNLAFGYDDLRQIHILNDRNSTTHCRGINEAIVA